MVFITSRKGVMKHEAKYKSTNKSSGLMKLANVAVQVATVKTGNTGKLLTVYQGDQMIHKGSMVDGLNDNWDYANKLKADRQAKQNRGSNQFPYVYTKLKTGKKGLTQLGRRRN